MDDVSAVGILLFYLGPWSAIRDLLSKNFLGHDNADTNRIARGDWTPQTYALPRMTTTHRLLARKMTDSILLIRQHMSPMSTWCYQGFCCSAS